jgi:hypothetical protein
MGRKLWLAIAALAGLGGPVAAAPPACDRGCLQGFVERYLDALVAHAPGRLPLAAGARFTENGQTLALGDGLWGTIEARDGYELTFADPRAGQVGAFVTVRESGRHQILGLRLKVTKGRIAEIETLVVRPKQGVVFGEPAALEPDPEMTTALTPAERRPREELVRIADSYFEGLVHATETLTPFADDCRRIENGIVTANNPAVPKGGLPVWALGCHAQFATHFSQFITRVRDRRYPVVDEERGLVYAEVFFDHAGRIKTQTLADGTVSPVPPDMTVPYTFEIGELFKIKDGKILHIEALVMPAPYGMRPGWPR